MKIQSKEAERVAEQCTDTDKRNKNLDRANTDKRTKKSYITMTF